MYVFYVPLLFCTLVRHVANERDQTETHCSPRKSPPPFHSSIVDYVFIKMNFFLESLSPLLKCMANKMKVHVFSYIVIIYVKYSNIVRQNVLKSLSIFMLILGIHVLTQWLRWFHIKTESQTPKLVIFPVISELNRSKMDLLGNISKCPFCKAFSTTSIDEFLCHLRKHQCTKCTLYHKSPIFRKSCIAAKENRVTLNCCVPKCSLSFVSVNQLKQHLIRNHKRCVTCQKFTCQCFHGKLTQIYIRT